jgi:hypothetical protein
VYNSFSLKQMLTLTATTRRIRFHQLGLKRSKKSILQKIITRQVLRAAMRQAAILKASLNRHLRLYPLLI